MSAALWLARRELAGRRGRAAIAALVVAAASAFVTATEALARGREDAIARQVDALGAPIRILPRGISAEALARYDLGSSPLPADAEARLRETLGATLRVREARRSVTAKVEGVIVPVVVASSGAARVDAGDAVLGSIAASRIGERQTITVAGEPLRIASVLPATATVDDTVVYVSAGTMERLGGPAAPTELRVFLAPGADARAASAALSAAFADAQVLRTDRGDVADREMDGALARHRAALYLVTGVVAALSLLIAAHLDAAERRAELATLVAVGATRSTLTATLVSRSVLLATTGSAAGIALGFVLASVLGAGPGLALIRATAAATSVLLASIGVAAFASLPPALAAAARSPVIDLQDG